MKREVILVEVINGSDLSTEKSMVFTDTDRAEDYFTELVREWFPAMEQDEIDNALDDGFLDFDLTSSSGNERKSVSMKVITFEFD